MEPIGLIGVITVAAIYIGLNIFGAMMGIGCDHWNDKARNRDLLKFIRHAPL